jgi:flagellar M-ring protein FliF
VRGVLEGQQVNAIRHLTASAVTGLKPERVSVVDEAGRLLADGSTRHVFAGAGGKLRRAPQQVLDRLDAFSKS